MASFWNKLYDRIFIKKMFLNTHQSYSILGADSYTPFFSSDTNQNLEWKKNLQVKFIGELKFASVININYAIVNLGLNR